MTCKGLMVFVATLLLATGALPPSADAQRDRARFDPIIEQAIATLPAEAGAVTDRDVDFIRQSGGSREGRLRRVVVWLRVEACETGFVNINLNRNGRVTDIYTRGGCQVPGL